MSPDLRSKLDRVTNILFAGGVSNPVTYIEQLSYLIYLKLLDEEETDRLRERELRGEAARRPQLFPGSAERFRWTEWRHYSGDRLRNFVRDQVFPYLGSLVKEEPRIAEYFRDAVLEIVDPHVLQQVVAVIDTIEFARLGTDIKGDIFEYLLSYTQGQETLGQFRTPRQIRKMMVAMVDPDFGDSLHDPCCGTAGFLIDAIEHVLAKYSSEPVEVPIYGESWLERQGLALAGAKEKYPRLQTYLKGPGERLPDWPTLERAIFGTDVSRQMMRIASMNLVLHGFPNARVKRANPISEMSGLTEDDLRRRYKVILSNPPFAGMVQKESIRNDLPTTSKKSELLFLALMMDSLAPGGRAAIVVPEGLLFGSSGAHVELRRKLLAEFEVLAVVSLPGGVFKPYAGVKTSVLVFRRPPEDTAPRLGRVWFHEISNDGYDPDKVSGGGRVETPESSQIPALLGAWAAFKSGGFTAPPGPESTATLDPHDPEPACWHAPLQRILDNNANLAASAYKPQRAARRSEEDPVELVERLQGIENEILGGLGKLKKLIST